MSRELGLSTKKKTTRLSLVQWVAAYDKWTLSAVALEQATFAQCAQHKENVLKVSMFVS